MNGIKPFPTAMESIDDILHVTMSDGQVVTKGPVNGYPGLQMSYLGVDPEGTAYWEDALGVRTDISTISTRLEINYSSLQSGLYAGLEDLNEFYVGILEDNDYIEIDKSLLRIWPATPVAISNVGFGDYLLTNDIKITSSSVYGSYSVLEGITDNAKWFAWNSTEAGQWFQIEYPAPILIIAFDYEVIGWSTSYRLNKATIQTSMNGHEWDTVYVIEDGTKDLEYQRITPTVCRYIRLVTDMPGMQGFNKFIPFSSRAESILGYNIIESWYDPSSVRLVEQDNYFEVAPVFDKALDTEDAIYLDNNNSTVAISTGVESLYTNVLRNEWHFYKFDLAINNNLNLESSPRCIYLTPGQYVINFNYLLKTDVGTQRILGDLGLVNTDTMVPLDGLRPIETDNTSMDAYPMQGRFEFYISETTAVAFGIKTNFGDYNYSDTTEYNCKLDIQKISLTPVMTYLEPHATLRLTPILRDRSGTVIDYPGTPYHTITINGFGLCTYDTRNEYYRTLEVWRDLTDRDLNITLLEPMSPVAFRLGQFNATHKVLAFEVWCKVSGEWIKVGTCENYDTEGEMEHISLVPATSKEWKVRFIGVVSDGVSLRVSNMEFYEDTPVLGRSLPYVLTDLHNTIDSYSFSAKDLRRWNRLAPSATYDEITFTVEATFNLYILPLISSALANLLAVKLTYMGDSVPTLTPDMSLELIPLAMSLPAGTYKLDGAYNISDIYLEEVL